MTKKTFITRIFIAVLLIVVYAYLYNIQFKYDTINSSELKFGSLHIVFNFFLLVTIVWIIGDALFASLSDGCWDFEDDGQADESSPLFNFKLSIWKIVSVATIIFLVFQFSKFYSGGKSMYNKSIIYHNNYIQTVQEKQGFYENLYNSYNEQKMISGLGKDGFIELSKIIMENRKDGNKVAWKWVQETQQIPFSEFTKFYTNLSEFIATKRDDYLEIEKRCQKIANQNNTLLDTFPNIIYNKVINCKRIEFEYGFAGEKQTEIFTLKKK